MVACRPREAALQAPKKIPSSTKPSRVQARPDPSHSASHALCVHCGEMSEAVSHGRVPPAGGRSGVASEWPMPVG